MASPPPHSAPPRTLGPYRLERFLGKGSFGVVYLATKIGPAAFRQKVALKILRMPRDGKNAKRIKDIANEAQILCRLRHPNVVGFLDFTEDDGHFFLVMDYIDGVNLTQIVRQLGPLPAAVVRTLAIQTLRGLSYAHQLVDWDGVPRPVVHRDLKPCNLMVGRDGQLRIMDFGLALADFRPWSTTLPGVLKGSPRYMSPEQVLGRTTDERSDLFALGSVMYGVLAGHHLFVGKEPLKILAMIRDAEVEERLSRFIGTPAEPLLPVLRRVLSREPADRYPSATAMLAALEAIRLPPVDHLLIRDLVERSQQGPGWRPPARPQPRSVAPTSSSISLGDPEATEEFVPPPAPAPERSSRRISPRDLARRAARQRAYAERSGMVAVPENKH